MTSTQLRVARICCFVVAVPIFFVDVQAQLVPGSGHRLPQVGDDFEDVNWKWIPNGEKASREQDEQVRSPTGFSANRQWFESPKRGMPDFIARVDTPEGGIPGSHGALKLQTLHSGIPGRPSGEMEQDDLVMSCASKVGAISVGRNPSCMTRIWIPPFEQWEKRSGSHFGYRIDLKTTTTEKKKTFIFTKTERKQEDYWPGFFIEFHSKNDPRFKEDEALLLIRGNNTGHEVNGPKLTPGWWTLGMSVTSDGKVHYYASPGVDNLTAGDHVYSSFPYGYQAEYFATHFFNTCNMYDGRTWSTPFIIDDPAIYTVR